MRDLISDFFFFFATLSIISAGTSAVFPVLLLGTWWIIVKTPHAWKGGERTFVCLCACAKVCSSNQALLLETCAVHRFFVLLQGAGGLSLWLIDIWSFCLLHRATIKAEGGKNNRVLQWGSQKAPKADRKALQMPPREGQCPYNRW